jgi:hypothetical protein
VLARGFVDEVDLLAERARAEEEDHDQGVGEADFGAVDRAIADGFEEGERCFVLRVEDDGFERGLGACGQYGGAVVSCRGSGVSGGGRSHTCRAWRDDMMMCLSGGVVQQSQPSTVAVYMKWSCGVRYDFFHMHWSLDRGYEVTQLAAQSSTDPCSFRVNVGPAVAYITHKVPTSYLLPPPSYLLHVTR